MERSLLLFAKAKRAKSTTAGRLPLHQEMPESLALEMCIQVVV